MTKMLKDGVEHEVAPERVDAFLAAGWKKAPKPKKKAPEKTEETTE